MKWLLAIWSAAREIRSSLAQQGLAKKGYLAVYPKTVPDGLSMVQYAKKEWKRTYGFSVVVLWNYLMEVFSHETLFYSIAAVGDNILIRPNSNKISLSKYLSNWPGIAQVFRESGGGIRGGSAPAGLDRNLRLAGPYGWAKIPGDRSAHGPGRPAG